MDTSLSKIIDNITFSNSHLIFYIQFVDKWSFLNETFQVFWNDNHCLIQNIWPILLIIFTIFLIDVLIPLFAWQICVSFHNSNIKYSLLKVVTNYFNFFQPCRMVHSWRNPSILGHKILTFNLPLIFSSVFCKCEINKVTIIQFELFRLQRYQGTMSDGWPIIANVRSFLHKKCRQW